MPSVADQYLDYTAAPEALRLWGVSVTLWRGQKSTVTTAEWGRPKSDALETEGLPLAINSREWTIAKSAYVFGGVSVEPRDGDRIEEADGTRWQVLPNEGESSANSSGDDWQILTKMVPSGD
jgi:hypothetical protein